ncbi:MAG: NUDIX hydrolase [Firmicutes bacterium]|nr:NUDIX hydrolase [Bacillota bacterium]
MHGRCDVGEKTIKSETKYEGKFISLRVDEVILDNGKTATREVVEHPGAAAILAVTKEKEAFFVRQYRKATEKVLLEIPAGKLDPGETPRDCAERELAEEVGMAANDLRLLAAFYTSPGFATERIYVYLATGLKPKTDAKPDEDEILDAQRIPLQEAVQMAKDGEIEDAKTMIALLLAADLGLAR